MSDKLFVRRGLARQRELLKHDDKLSGISDIWRQAKEYR